MKNILIISDVISSLEETLIFCLKENDYTVFSKPNIFFEGFNDYLLKNKIDVLILNRLYGKFRKKEAEKLAEVNVKKTIILENAKDIYIGNSKPPFSVYNPFKPKNRKSKEIKYSEDLIKQKENYVIFRISEVYGPHVNSGLIHELFSKNKITLFKGEHDFLYEGDFIHAVEVALKFDAIGIFDIANGEAQDMNKVIELVNKYRENKIVVRWRRKRETVSCLQSFQFYKWNPIVSLNCGLRAINNKQRS